MKRLTLLLSLACAGMAHAQTLEPPGAVGQIGGPARPVRDVGSSQIGTSTRNVATPLLAAPSALPPPQLTTPNDAAPPAQLVHEARTGRGTAQISKEPPSARAPAPVSRPADGRTAAVARVNGRDRCDPATGTPGHACTHVIETRGADFPPPTAEPLSAEQQQLVEQRTIERRGAEADTIARTAAQRIGRDGTDADSPNMQGLASVVLGTVVQTPAKTIDPAAGLTPDQAAIATSVLGGLTATPR